MLSVRRGRSELLQIGFRIRRRLQLRRRPLPKHRKLLRSLWSSLYLNTFAVAVCVSILGVALDHTMVLASADIVLRYRRTARLAPLRLGLLRRLVRLPGATHIGAPSCRRMLLAPLDDVRSRFCWSTTCSAPPSHLVLQELTTIPTTSRDPLCIIAKLPGDDRIGRSRHSRHSGVSGSPQERAFGQCPRL